MMDIDAQRRQIARRLFDAAGDMPVKTCDLNAAFEAEGLPRAKDMRDMERIINGDVDPVVHAMLLHELLEIVSAAPTAAKASSSHSRARARIRRRPDQRQVCR